MLENSLELSGDSLAIAIRIISALSLISGPVLLSLVLCFYWTRTRRPLMPPIFAAVPLALTSVCLQVTATGLSALKAFQEASSGPVEVTQRFIQSDQSLLWRVIESALCVAAFALFQLATAKRAGADTSASKFSISVAGWSVLSALVVVWIIWLSSDTVKLCTLLIARAGTLEGQDRLIGMGIGKVTAMLARREQLLAVVPPTLTFFLLIAGVKCLEAGRRRKWDFAISAVLAVTVTGWLGVDTSVLRSQLHTLHNVANSYAQWHSQETGSEVP